MGDVEIIGRIDSIIGKTKNDVSYSLVTPDGRYFTFDIVTDGNTIKAYRMQSFVGKPEVHVSASAKTGTTVAPRKMGKGAAVSGTGGRYEHSMATIADAAIFGNKYDMADKYTVDRYYMAGEPEYVYDIVLSVYQADNLTEKLNGRTDKDEVVPGLIPFRLTLKTISK